jgi:outer membrane protein
MLMKLRYFIIVFWSWSVIVSAQSKTVDFSEKLTLERCIELGIAHNPAIAQTIVQADMSGITLKQSINNRLPSVNSSVSQFFSFGRTLDPFTNEYKQSNAYYNNYNLGASVTVYNGFQLKNTIEQNKLNLQVSQAEANTLKFTQSVQIANAFLLVLNNEELLTVAQEQLKMSVSQFERVEKLFKIGSTPLANLNELKIQLANDEFAVKNAKNNILSAKLGLLQAMNVHGYSVENVQLSREDVQQELIDNQANNDELVSNYPSVLLNKTKVKASAFGINIAKAGLFPTLSLSAGLSSSYSSLAPSQFPFFDKNNPIVQDVPTGNFVSIGGRNYDVIGQSQLPNGFRELNYFGQLDFNLNQYISINLNIPIFDRFTVRNRIATANLQVKSAESQLKIVEEQVLREIETLVMQKDIAKSKYEAIKEQLKVIEDSFRFAESKFNLGTMNYIDFNLLKTNYEKTKISLTQAKYELILKEKIYQLYQKGVK